MKLKNCSGKRGMSIVELLVVMSIIVVLSAVVLANWSGGNKQYQLDRAASKLVQDIRRAEELSMSAKDFNGQVPEGGYGIFFETSNPNHYILFADVDNSQTYSEGDGLVEDIKIEKDIKISQLSSPLSNPLNITFVPPDPQVSISPDAAFAQITLSIKSDPTKTKTVEINKAGLVYVKKEACPNHLCGQLAGEYCLPAPAGEHGLPACQKCNGISIDPVSITGFVDSEGSNTCAGTCAAYCNSGSCINTDTSAGTCTISSNTRVVSGGDGHCSSSSCAFDCYGSGIACSSGSQCCSGNCYTDADGDRYAPSSGTKTCRANSQLSGTDCNDNNSAIYPGTSCGTVCTICQISGSCGSAPNTGWGTNLYGCTGSSKRCYSGSCVTCGGYIASDNCGGCAGQGGNACWYLGSNNQACYTTATTTSSVCTHGCVAANWNDSTSCSVLSHWFPSQCASTSSPCSGMASNLSPVYRDRCWYRSSGSQNCAAYSGGGWRRICVCNY